MYGSPSLCLVENTVIYLFICDEKAIFKLLEMTFLQTARRLEAVVHCMS